MEERGQIDAAELRGVILAQRQPGDGPQLEMVELYEDGLGVRYSEPQHTDPFGEDFPPLWHSFAVTDDVGTTYTFAEGGAQGSRRRVRGLALFVPRVPEGAAILTVTWGSNKVTFDLSRLVEPPA